MNIAGSGVVPEGEYGEKISVAGSAAFSGNVKCPEIRSSGSLKAEGDVDCTGSVETAGSFSSAGSVRAGKIIKTAGSAKIDGDLKCETLRSAGSIYIGGEIEAENVFVGGAVRCSGLMNAENVEIRFSDDSHAGSIGGGTIKIIKENEGKEGNIIINILFVKVTKETHSSASSAVFTVDEAIEGDTVAVEYVRAPLVTGRVVAIGAGCVIDTVRYHDQIEISPDAKVGRTEKEEST